MSQLPFNVFLCHNSADKSVVAKLATKLKDLGLNPWLDAWHLGAGEPWLPAIERALGNSDACAVIVGPNGLGNVHEDEMWVALQHGIESKRESRRFRIIPILLPNSTRGDRLRLPKFLTANTWVEFTRSIEEPVAIEKLVKAIRGDPPGAQLSLPKGECPYRGLAYFDIQHASLFFGREALTDWLLSRLRGTATKEGATRFLAIVGASGSGKSSLGRAGVLAQIRKGDLVGSERWPQVICRPGSQPLINLATELAGLGDAKLDLVDKTALIRKHTTGLANSPDQLHLVAQAAMPANDSDWRLVVFVDQFEELFSLNTPDQRNPQTDSSLVGMALTADRVAFIRNLLYAATIENGRTIVILTMRADFYAKCASHPELAAAVSQHQELVGPMNAEELRRAIETPAQLSGSDIEPGLVDLLAHEVAEQPGALPQLEYALAELWQKSSDLGLDKLTTLAYRELGGWEGALSRRADAVLAAFKNSPQEQLCRQLFLRLVQPGEGTEDTKRLVHWQEFSCATPSEAAALELTVRKLAENRLIVMSGDDLTADSTVEVVHEALIRGWPELRQWLDADRTGLRTHRHLTDAAAEWARSHAESDGRDPSLLYHGTRLSVAQEWAKTSGASLNLLEREFLESSVAQAEEVARQNDRQRQERLEQSERLLELEMKSGRRFRMTVVTVASFLVAGVLGLMVVGYFWWDDQNRLRAEGLVKQLDTSEIAVVQTIIQEIHAYRRWADPLLKQRFSSKTVDPRARLHAAIALMPVDDTPVGYLYEQLMQVTPAEFPVVREALRSHRDSIGPKLWVVALKTKLNPRNSFQAACALADYAPDDERWGQIRRFLVNHLLNLEASELVEWRKSLWPAKSQLLEPLAAIYRAASEREQVRIYATESLAYYAGADPEMLFDLLAEAEQFQFPRIFRKLEAHRDRAVDLGRIELAKQAAEVAGEDDREKLGRRQANAAVMLLKLGATDAVWPLLKHRPDPRARSNVIHWLSPLAVDPEIIIRRFDDESDVTIRRALLLALGEFTEAQLPPVNRSSLTEKLFAVYESNPDPGLHGAAEWLLTRWQQQARLSESLEKLKETEQQLLNRRDSEGRHWYVSTLGQTFVIVDAGAFDMGTPITEAGHQVHEIQHRHQIDRRFAIAATEVTQAQFERFRSERPEVPRFNLEDFVKTDDSPQVAVDWYDAAAYCNWLSEKEGISKDQWCYEPNDENKFAAGMKPKPKHLELIGYRLPTEAEWEFACRAETVTSRYYGVAEDLLSRYAWFTTNSENKLWPVSRLKPNDFGLFDMLGNTFEWCEDRYPTPTTAKPGELVEDAGDETPLGEQARILRGGSFNSPLRGVRSGSRSAHQPKNRYNFTGFRPARTFE